MAYQVTPPERQRNKAHKPIDKEKFETLCQSQCNQTQLCAALNCHRDTLNSWCRREYNCSLSSIHQKKQHQGKAELLQSMFRLATKSKNHVMLIWLSKNWLGFKDAVDSKMVAEIGRAQSKDLRNYLKELHKAEQSEAAIQEKQQ